MESESRSMWLRHPFVAAGNQSWFAGVAALVLGAFLAGGWFAAVSALVLVRAAQSLLRFFGRGTGGGWTLGLV